jgi:Zn-dependent M28 family amino/carboxypeptidase
MLKIARSQDYAPVPAHSTVTKILGEVAEENLRAFVKMFAFPRHFFAQYQANRRARDLLLTLATEFGYRPTLQGDHDNVVLTSPGQADGPFVLLGAHYDSVPGTPGADDNGSAMAVCLECARLVAQHDIGPVMIVFFNREEDGLLGSREFVASLAKRAARRVSEAHVFEMVGYRSRAPGSQQLPRGLPIPLTPDAGDFLALLANRGSNVISDNLLGLAARYVPQFPVIALQVHFGIERAFADLIRSDHAPFWRAGIPAIMWTDTSEFRNPHYHRQSDTPDTLDYDFMAEVTRLALARAISQAPHRDGAQ